MNICSRFEHDNIEADMIRNQYRFRSVSVIGFADQSDKNRNLKTNMKINWESFDVVKINRRKIVVRRDMDPSNCQFIAKILYCESLVYLKYCVSQ